ncbi:hypothetical protein C0J52_26233, partial [Blattella germanica]
QSDFYWTVGLRYFVYPLDREFEVLPHPARDRGDDLRDWLRERRVALVLLRSAIALTDTMTVLTQHFDLQDGREEDPLL